MKEYARLTIDMSPEEHTCLKIASAHLSLSMREFVLLAAFHQIEELKDPNLSKQARKTIKHFEALKQTNAFSKP